MTRFRPFIKGRPSVSALAAVSVVLGFAVTTPATARAAEWMSVSERAQQINKTLEQRKVMFRREEIDSLTMSILTRKHPEYDPVNLRAGDFTIAPALTVGVSHSDNVYETNGNKVKDYLTTAKADITAKSDFITHEIKAAFSIEDGRYRDTKDENYRDYRADLSGRYDIDDIFSVPVKFSYTQDHTRRDAPDDRTGEKPTVYSVAAAETGVHYVGYFLDISFLGNISVHSYDDNRTSLGALIYNGDRDRTEFSNTLKIGASEKHDIAPFAYLGYQIIDYHDARDDFNVNRDSAGWKAGIGTAFALSGVVTSKVQTGLVHRSFKDADLKDIQSVDFGADITWEPSSLIAFSLLGGRQVNESSLADTSASIDSRAGFKINYELAPNIYLYPEVEFLVRDYQSADNREIKRLQSGVTAAYKMNRNIWIDLSFENTNRKEKTDGAAATDAKTNTGMMTVRFQM